MRCAIPRPGAARAVQLAFALAGVAYGCSKDESRERDAPRELAGLRPNIVLLLTDDQRYDTLGCTGNPWVKTPNFDWLAENGVLFENATVATPRCCPSRASILTGEYAHRTGVVSNDPGRDPLAASTIFPELLQQHGYETAFIGKWHLPNPGAAPHRGFDHWVSFELQGDYYDQALNVNGGQVSTQGFLTDVLAEYAAAWIGKPRNAPFFLFLSLKNCHSPFDPPARHSGLLRDAPVGLPPSFRDPPEALPAHYRLLRRSGLAITAQAGDAYLVQTLRSYLELVLSADDCLHAVLQSLFRTDQLGRTLVATTSDNGFLWGEHGLLFKSAAYEPSIRVPLILSWPGHLPENTRESRPILNVDLAPTFLELAGAAVPAAMQGRSLLDLWRESGAGWRSVTVHYEPIRKGSGHPREFALRGARWKYIALGGASPEELLFDLIDDPHERSNLALDPNSQSTLAERRHDLHRELDRLEVPESWRRDLPRFEQLEPREHHRSADEEF